jgi:hypothetical protein
MASGVERDMRREYDGAGEWDRAADCGLRTKSTQHEMRTSRAPLVTHRHTKHETRLVKSGRGLRRKARIEKLVIPAKEGTRAV